jgi:RNA polymerase sigma factor (sigma-70 family)
MKSDEATVFLVDDDPMVRKALSWLLQLSGYTVEAFDAPRGFLASASPVHPSCAVVDLQMPEMSGLELQAALTSAGWALPLVFLTGQGDVLSSVRAMKGGAVDFLLKPVDEEELLAAVKRALCRDARAREERDERTMREQRLAHLSERERAVCDRVAQGMLNKQIAAALGVTEGTVKQHRARGMEKLGVGSAAELARLLERLGPGA